VLVQNLLPGGIDMNFRDEERIFLTDFAILNNFG